MTTNNNFTPPRYAIRWKFKFSRFKEINPVHLKEMLTNWSTFMSQITNRKISPHDSAKIIRFREVLPRIFDLTDIIDGVLEQRPDLMREFADIAPLFDRSPRDLKIQILANLDIDPDKLDRNLTNY